MSCGRRSTHITALLCCCAIAGCTASQPTPPPVDPSEYNLQVIFRTYRMAEVRNKRPPAKLTDIKESFGADDPEAVLTSPRDNQRYVIAWGQSSLMPTTVRPTGDGVSAPPTYPLLAYEQTGRDGKRYVVNILGQVSLLGDDEFSQVMKKAKAAAR